MMTAMVTAVELGRDCVRGRDHEKSGNEREPISMEEVELGRALMHTLIYVVGQHRLKGELS